MIQFAHQIKCHSQAWPILEARLHLPTHKHRLHTPICPQSRHVACARSYHLRGAPRLILTFWFVEIAFVFQAVREGEGGTRTAPFEGLSGDIRRDLRDKAAGGDAAWTNLSSLRRSFFHRRRLHPRLVS